MRVKLLLPVLLTFFISLSWAFAGKHVVKEVGVSLTLPDIWKHIAEDRFGYLIRREPEDPKKRGPRIRIHNMGFEKVSLQEAVKRGLDKINANKHKQGIYKETLERAEEFTTASGIKGIRAVIGPGEDYLDRNYFIRPDGTIFCVCLYKAYQRPDLTEEGREAIQKTLKLLPGGPMPDKE